MNRPPKKIPKKLLNGYSMNGQIDILNWWINNMNSTSLDWTDELINAHIEAFSNDNIQQFNYIEIEPYRGAAKLHLHAIMEYPIDNKDVAIVGSLKPWIESICINNNAKSITTVEYNVPICNHPKIKTISYNDFTNESNKYDVIITFSSVEHSGLGRYGDALNPDGDIETMNVIHNALKSDGIVLWGAPVGYDCVAFNAHRIYGKKRLKLLFQKFNIVKWFGYDESILNKWTEANVTNFVQPVILLNKI